MVMNIPRLMKLIEILERVPPSHLKMSVWCMRDYEGKRSIKNAIENNFAGCVGGWAAQSKAFQKQGFTLERSDNFMYIAYKSSHGLTYTNLNAFGHFFGLTRPQTENIVYNSNYDTVRVTPQMVITKIKKLIEGHES